jgi:hypothetical protein
VSPVQQLKGKEKKVSLMLFDGFEIIWFVII